MAKLSSVDSELLLAIEYICEEHGRATPQQLADDLDISMPTLKRRLSPTGALRVDELVECVVEDDDITSVLITPHGLEATNGGGMYDTKEVRELRAQLAEASSEIERLKTQTTIEPGMSSEASGRPKLKVVPDPDDPPAPKDEGDTEELDLSDLEDESGEADAGQDEPAVEIAALTLVSDRDRATIVGTDPQEQRIFELEQAVRTRGARIEALEEEVAGLRGGTLDNMQRLREKIAAAEAAREPDRRRIAELEGNYQKKVGECINLEREKRNLQQEVRTLTGEKQRLLLTGGARQSA
jgi:hypothetical protein